MLVTFRLHLINIIFWTVAHSCLVLISKHLSLKFLCRFNINWAQIMNIIQWIGLLFQHKFSHSQAWMQYLKGALLIFMLYVPWAVEIANRIFAFFSQNFWLFSYIMVHRAAIAAASHHSWLFMTTCKCIFATYINLHRFNEQSPSSLTSLCCDTEGPEGNDVMTHVTETTSGCFRVDYTPMVAGKWNERLYQVIIMSY